MNPKKSFQIALGGVFSSLCLLLMFLSSMIPFSSFALPMLSGATLIVVVEENGVRTALLVYICVSLLSIFIVSDLDTKLLFILFFGYYSIIKPKLEAIPRKSIRFFAKLLIFNAAIIIAYFISLKLVGLDSAIQESEFLSKYLPGLMLVALDFSFLVYDFLLTRCTKLYLYWFRPTFLRR